MVWYVCVLFVGGIPSLMPYGGTGDGHGIGQVELNKYRCWCRRWNYKIKMRWAIARVPVIANTQS
jgi:hypothetical protein